MSFLLKFLFAFTLSKIIATQALDIEGSCEAFTEPDFQGDVLASLKSSDIIYDLSLSLVTNATTKQLIKSIKLHLNCKLLTCSLPKLKGRCFEHTESGNNSDSEESDFQSASCKCSNNLERSGKSQISECAIFNDQWYYTGHSQKVLFPGNAGKLEAKVDGDTVIKSVLIKKNCKVILWKQEGNKDSSVLLDESSTFIPENLGNYEWYCCSCDTQSDEVCRSAKNISSLLPSRDDNAEYQDYSRFVQFGKKVIGIGRNYRWKASELAKVLKEPEEPIVFLKPSTSYIIEGQEIKLPESLGTIFYEIELGVIIGKRGKFIKESEALDHVAGYFLALDMTAKEFLKKSISQSRPWEIGKGFDTACPVSHFIPKNLIPDPNNIHLLCKVNGNVTQSENTSQMIFNVPTLISYISKYMTLEPYDTILTGTPDGLGPIYHGDVIEGQLGNVTTVRFEAITIKD